MEKILHEIIINENFDAHQDWEVPIPGFVVVASKVTDRRSLADFSSTELTELVLLLKDIRVAMRDVLSIKDIYLFQNEDTEHGFHVWMFPRHEWMEKFGKKIQSVRPIIEYAKENLFTEENLKEVKKSAELLKSYLQNQSTLVE